MKNNEDYFDIYALTFKVSNIWISMTADSALLQYCSSEQLADDEYWLNLSMHEASLKPAKYEN